MAIRWTFDDIPDLTGRTAVVTGATSGLGLVVAQQLAAHGADVIAGVRDPAKATRVAPGLEARRVDLADLDSVGAFAGGLHRDGRVVDLLVNNAGIGGHQGRRLSPQGIEMQFATNFLGHFALTGRLLDLIRDGGRVVHVGSNLYRHFPVELPLDDLAAERSYSPSRAYVASKLANLLFGLELDRRLRRAGRPVRSLVAHPGLARTALNSDVGQPALRATMAVLNALISRPAERAAIPLLFAATDPAAHGGVFIGPRNRRWDDRVHLDRVVAPANDPALADQLWERAQDWAGVGYPPDLRS
ncbi:SDR family NAD(P)-dependent oxidoreductase [Micromonospora sp. WMMD975]|uniref:SDR family NAD(P)-dependent oxidoreductase n=1 Tax=Micromonospora sp. WMMD975 TaxID=3016087 RepID=UPI00249C4717|nr:SDR family NAD(P)-dependent oxidoreductase [Micromonospora sp. WMMD975]WFE33241.1 SDR family NAD(P)-dependent oxidoreductase [Micromonospora sp. WMMD975]